jgi:hypothetical protein
MANPIEVHFGPLRELVLDNSNHPITSCSPAASTPTSAGVTPTLAPPSDPPLITGNEPASEQRKRLTMGPTRLTDRLTNRARPLWSGH